MNNTFFILNPLFSLIFHKSTWLDVGMDLSSKFSFDNRALDF